ncbi:MAG: hypothetical protein DHS20C11_11690 [Lysobacteraceae bacterium]|nr:MAG: hypothetical protein DHS20C11_11690 [Xanthomonadaceae bacterium]
MKGAISKVQVLVFSGALLASNAGFAEPLPCEGYSIGNEPWISVYSPGFGFPCEVEFAVQSDTSPTFAYVERPLSPWLTQFSYTAQIQAELDSLDAEDEWTFLELAFGRAPDTNSGGLVLSLLRDPSGPGSWSLEVVTDNGTGNVSVITTSMGTLEDPFYLTIDWLPGPGNFSAMIDGTPIALGYVSKFGRPRILRAGLVYPLQEPVVGSRVMIGSNLQVAPDR